MSPYYSHQYDSDAPERRERSLVVEETVVRCPRCGHFITRGQKIEGAFEFACSTKECRRTVFVTVNLETVTVMIRRMECRV